ncbi:PHP domain-containing protein [Idiomarina sp.]|uniref:PHP domain-containing protein n=1 Tax=Idiomarina sp. TaxID=1874361 RepID=UPI0025C5138D|nr:PHP domain-containing protein [Idiomarina sp.]NQZ04155.1 PHP domain-containing protein [Idiomarina sp.]
MRNERYVKGPNSQRGFNLIIDLHCHTTHSDGSLTVPELIDRAHNNNVSVLALTDHDNIDGVGEAQQYIEQVNYELTLVAGVELSCWWESFEIHIVGLNVDTRNDSLRRLLQTQQNRRRERIDSIIQKLASRDINVEIDSEGIPTRKHIADQLVQQGYVDKVQKAFDRFIGKGNFAYVRPQWCSIGHAIKAIHEAGGSAVLAHPHAYQLSNKWLRKLIGEAKAWGLDGLEVSIGQQTLGQRSALAEFANDFQLKASQGSDFHYPSQWRDLGKNLCLPDTCVPIWNDWFS